MTLSDSLIMWDQSKSDVAVFNTCSHHRVSRALEFPRRRYTCSRRQSRTQEARPRVVKRAVRYRRRFASSHAGDTP